MEFVVGLICLGAFGLPIAVLIKTLSTAQEVDGLRKKVQRLQDRLNAMQDQIDSTNLVLVGKPE